MPSDDWINSQYDPYDLLQEHEVMISRLVKAHNAMDTVVTELTRNQIKFNSRIEQLEDELNRIYNYLGEQQ